MQGWNGTVPKAGQRRGASVGAGQKSGACEAGAREYGAREKGRGAGRRRQAEPRGCVREAGEGKGRAKRRDCSGEGEPRGRALAEGELEHGGEERKDVRPEPKKGRPFGEAAGLSRDGAAEICRRGARRLRADSCPWRKHCVRTRAARTGQERTRALFQHRQPGPLARAEILEWRTGRHNAKAAPQGQGGEA